MDSLFSRDQLSSYYKYPFDLEFFNRNGHLHNTKLDIGYGSQWSSRSIGYLLNEGE